jgi:chloramphenicol O-acetyltransferase type A
MKKINISKWPRRTLFEFYRKFDYPHFGLCVDVDMATLKKFTEKEKISFFQTTVYLIVRVASEIPELRTRIRGDDVIEHSKLDASFTAPAAQNLFSFCTVPFSEDPKRFFKSCDQELALRKNAPVTLELDQPYRDDVFFMSCMPWVKFTSVLHPVHLSPIDSVPRFAWGKIEKSGKRLMMPLSLQAHHALADGYHAGLFYERFQDTVARPQSSINLG